jgi:hypothetical protein
MPKSNIKIVERGKIDTPNTQIHDCSLSWLSTGTLIKSGGVNLNLIKILSLFTPDYARQQNRGAIKDRILIRLS